MAKSLSDWLRGVQTEVQAFYNETGIGSQDESQMSRGRKFAHFWLVVVKHFIRNRCPVRASALAYTTLLSLVPLLAIVISVSTSFLKTQGDKPIKYMIDQLVDNVAPQLGLVSRSQDPNSTEPGAREQITQNIQKFVANVSSGTLGLTGAISLIAVAILLLSSIEQTFNDIWGVQQGRSWFWRVVLYWAAITLGPLFLVITIGLTTGPHLEAIKNLLAQLPFVGGLLVKLLFRLLPFIILSGAFSLFYALMPNTRVRWRAALVGGTIGGVLWQLNNLFNVIYVSKVVSYSKIYGGFGTVPLFLVGMYFSWVILLFGSQVAYVYQNRQAYLQEKQVENISQRGRELVAFRIMACVGEHFQKGTPPPNLSELSDLLGVPHRLICQTIRTLSQARLIVEVAAAEPAYTPTRPLSQITGKDFLRALRDGQGTDVVTRDSLGRSAVAAELERIRQAEDQAAEATTLQDLVDRVQLSAVTTSK